MYRDHRNISVWRNNDDPVQTNTITKELDIRNHFCVSFFVVAIKIYFGLLRDLQHRQDLTNKCFERRLKCMALFLSTFPKTYFTMIWPCCFYCSNSRGNFEMTVDVSVINNFSFLYMSWVFSPAFPISCFYLKFKIISISNYYNQHFIFEKTREQFRRNFINYIRKSFKLAVINIYCNIAMKSVPVAPRTGFPRKMVASIF